MSNEDKNNKNQSDENIDKIIDEAVENAESRRELSENELDEVAGGLMSTDGGTMKY